MSDVHKPVEKLFYLFVDIVIDSFKKVMWTYSKNKSTDFVQRFKGFR